MRLESLFFQSITVVIFFILFYFPSCAYLGPMVGSFLYSVGGFSLPYYVVGGLTTGLSLVLLLVVPNINKDSKEEEEEKNALIHKHGSTSKEMAEQEEKEEANKSCKPLSLMAVAMVRAT